MDDAEYRKKLRSIEEDARRLGRKLKQQLPPGVGFALALFTVGDADGPLTYLSNARREDMLAVLKQLVALLEHGAVAPPGQPEHPSHRRGPAN